MSVKKNSSYLKRSLCGEAVFVKVVDVIAFDYNFSFVDNTMILSLINVESKSKSKNDLSKDILFNDADETIYIFDGGLDIGKYFNSESSTISESEIGSLDIVGEVYVVKLAGVERVTKNKLEVNYYLYVKDYLTHYISKGVDLLFMSHSIDFKELFYDEILTLNNHYLNNVDLDLNVDNDIKKYIDVDGNIKAPLINLMNCFIANKNSSKLDSIDDYININFNFKSMGSSFSCKFNNLYIK